MCVSRLMRASSTKAVRTVLGLVLFSLCIFRLPSRVSSANEAIFVSTHLLRTSSGVQKEVSWSHVGNSAFSRACITL